MLAAPHHVLPDVFELLYPHRLDEEVTRAVSDAAHDCAVLVISRHHCTITAQDTATQHDAQEKEAAECGLVATTMIHAGCQQSTFVAACCSCCLCCRCCQQALTYYWQAQLQSHNLQKLETVHVCLWVQVCAGACGDAGRVTETIRCLAPGNMCASH